MKNTIFYALVFGAVCTPDVGANPQKTDKIYSTQGESITTVIASTATDPSWETACSLAESPQSNNLQNGRAQHKTGFFSSVFRRVSSVSAYVTNAFCDFCSSVYRCVSSIPRYFRTAPQNAAAQEAEDPQQKLEKMKSQLAEKESVINQLKSQLVHKEKDIKSKNDEINSLIRKPILDVMIASFTPAHLDRCAKARDFIKEDCNSQTLITCKRIEERKKKRKAEGKTNLQKSNPRSDSQQESKE